MGIFEHLAIGYVREMREGAGGFFGEKAAGDVGGMARGFGGAGDDVPVPIAFEGNVFKGGVYNVVADGLDIVVHGGIIPLDF